MGQRAHKRRLFKSLGMAQQQHLGAYVFAPKAKISCFKRSLSAEKTVCLTNKKTAQKEQLKRQ